MSERKTITITVPYTSRTTSTADEDFIGARGGEEYPRSVLVGHAGVEIKIAESDVGRAVLAAWPTEPTTDYAKRLAEIEADHAAYESETHGPALMVCGQRKWLLAQIRAAAEALTGAGIPDDGRPLAERISGLAAALRAAKVLTADGALGPVAEDIKRVAAMLSRVENGVTVEHRCADPSACPLCSKPTSEDLARGAAIAQMGTKEATIARLAMPAKASTIAPESPPAVTGSTRDAALAETDVEQLKTVCAHARKLIQGASLNTTSGDRAGITCDEEPYRALAEHFEAEREAARTIPGLVCAECDRNIYRGEQYAGKGGHAAHRACRNWPKGMTFKVAGQAQEGAAS